MSDWSEVNFDGLVGLSHNYSGLSYGNIASARNEGDVSNPREGVLQGLGKMAALHDMGMVQGVLPPQDRPHVSTLRALGFTGSDEEIVVAAHKSAPELLRNVSSASCMWTANAATVAPRPDTEDGRTHFTAANLTAMFHRSIEAETTARILARIFPEGDRFTHHDPLVGGVHMGDEGAANHNRFCTDYGDAGVELFVYGRRAFDKRQDLVYPGRQTLEASTAIARLHGLKASKTVFVEQSPKAINAGAFHNDVVAVSNKTCFFYHEHAFDDVPKLQADLRAAAGDDFDYSFVQVPADRVSLDDAVKSYLFNSQLISLPGHAGHTLILPVEAEEMRSTYDYVGHLLASDGPIRHAHYMDVRQSMRNGGGPACLRLRVALDRDDQAALGARVLFDDALHVDLKAWADKHYRDRVTGDDLGDPAFVRESFAALDDLTTILNLGSVYDFQRA